MERRKIERPRSVCLSLNLVPGLLFPSFASTTKTLNPLRPTNPPRSFAATPSLPRASMPPLESFWGVEVKPGQTVSCDPGKDCILRLSQVALGETKKGSASIVVSAKIDDQQVIVGTLSAENCPQLQCDLIFHKEIKLSHSSKTASVFVCGYKAVMPDMPESDSSKDEGEVKTVNHQVIEDLTENESSSEDDTSEGDNNTEEDDSSSEEIDTSSEEIATSSEEDSSDEEDKNNPMKPDDGKKRVAETALKTPAFDKKAKIATPSGETTGDKKIPHVATPHPAKQASDEDDLSEEDDNCTEDDDSSSEEIDTSSEEIATSSEEDSSDEEDKSTPKKPEDGKKTVAKTALKTPASDKKAKIATPSGETTGDKKVPHVATPHPATQTSKVPGSSNSKPKAKSPKSVGTHACKSCSRTFGSDAALQSHKKAKHV